MNEEQIAEEVLRKYYGNDIVILPNDRPMRMMLDVLTQARAEWEKEHRPDCKYQDGYDEGHKDGINEALADRNAEVLKAIEEHFMDSHLDKLDDMCYIALKQKLGLEAK